MAKNKNLGDEPIVDLEEAYSKTEQYVEDNKNRLSTILVIIVVAVGGYFAYQNFIIKPNNESAQNEMWKAQTYFETDSFQLALDGDDEHKGLVEIIDDYGSTKSGKLAKFYAGVSYLRLGEFENAIEYLTDFSSSDVMLSAIALGATGDAYMELDNASEALSYYKKAATTNSNDFSSPIYLMKAGLVYEQLGDYEGASEIYERIKKDYSKTVEGQNIDKYIARAKEMI